LNVIHATIVIVGLILIALVTAPLGLLVKEALENPTLLNASIEEENNTYIVYITYNGTIKLTDVNFTTILKSNSHVIEKSTTTSVLEQNSILKLEFPKNEIGSSNQVILREMILSGKVDGLYPFKITYKPIGG